MLSPLKRVAVAAAVAVAVAGCSSADASRPDVDVFADAAEVAPPRDGHLVDAGWPEAAAYIAREADAGRPVVLNVFADWCGPCKAEAPVLREAMAAYPDVTFLGVDHIDKREAGASFLREEGLDFDATLFDVTGDIAIAIGSRGMPTTAFFDREGKLLHTHTGVVDERMLAQRLSELEDAP